MPDGLITTRTGLRRVRIVARGRVQGVGFRPTFFRALTDRNCGGYIKNTPDGVVLEVEGAPAVVKELLDRFRDIAPPRADVVELEVHESEPLGESEFRIERSSSAGRSLLPIPPDMATCEQCREELRRPGCRRSQYAFNTCTECGPRFTLARSIPFDRATNSMADFALCENCSAEYRSRGDRRLHAQTISCPSCGPSLVLLDAGGRRMDSPLQTTRELLRAGKIVAIKGVGGFHLACDATRGAAVGELRRRKGRPHKPLAVMVGDLETCKRIGDVNETEEVLLTSAQAPIVLLRKRRECPVAEAVAPGLLYLGVMLPYTPLHLLLFADAGMPPALVMTSCNRSEEPIATEHEEVLAELGHIVDAVLGHDRQIVNRCDDSVLAVFDGRPLPVRRSRGYVPEPVLLPFEGPATFAAGAMLSNTFAVTSGRRAFISQHIGDVSDADNARHFARTFDRFCALLKLKPELVACDLHPDYPTTAFARELAEAEGLTLTQVQHHHAHAASCLVENGCTEEAIAVTFDGTGCGTDGAIWGGEFLVAGLGQFSRCYHFEYVPMPGGEEAVRNPDRMALAHLMNAFDSEEAVRRMSPVMGEQRCRLILEVAGKRQFSPPTSSCGRLFDAVCSLLGFRHWITYEGQAACELEMHCADGEAGRYDYGYEDDAVLVKGILAGVCRDIDGGVTRERIAARFHNTIAEIVAETCSRIRRDVGLSRVVLSGGVMQNRYLLSAAVPALQRSGFEVLLHSVVPPNDGGICLGQAAVALARSSSGRF